MTYALAGLIYSTFSSLFLILGVGTAINKSGDFFKILESENNDNFKKAFDKVAGDFVDDFGKSFESLNLITGNISKLFILFWELMIGEKFIKKTKDGKIIVDDKNIIFDDYKNKINLLNDKIKNYKNILEESNLGNLIINESDESDEDDNNSKSNSKEGSEENFNLEDESDEEIEEISADN